MQHNDLQDALAYLRTLFSTYESQGVQITGSRMPFTQYANFAAMKYLLFLANQDRVITDDEGKQRPLYEFVGQMVDKWGSDCMGDDYSYVGAVVGATYPEMGKVLRELMPKSYILVPGYGAQGGKGADLVHFFDKDGLGAIVNSSRGIIAAYKQEQYQAKGITEENFADASRMAVEAMIADIKSALN